MKKKILTFILSAVLLFGVVSVVSAIDLGSGLLNNAGKGAGYATNTSETTFAETLGTVVKAALSFVGVIFLALMVYAGFKWMNARGEEADIDKSKEIIKSAIIGLIITVGAYSITAFIVPRVLERTAGPGGGDRAVGSIEKGTCSYERGDGQQMRELNMTRQECINRCPGLLDTPNSNCEFASDDE